MVTGVILLGRMLQTQTNEAFLYLGGACLLILVGVYELHRQIPLLLHRFAKQNLRHKYKEEICSSWADWAAHPFCWPDNGCGGDPVDHIPDNHVYGLTMGQATKQYESLLSL